MSYTQPPFPDNNYKTRQLKKAERLTKRGKKNRADTARAKAAAGSRKAWKNLDWKNFSSVRPLAFDINE